MDSGPMGSDCRSNWLRPRSGVGSPMPILCDGSAPHIPALALGGASDSKQRTAHEKRAVSGQRTDDFARILCFVRQGTLNQPVLGSSLRGLTPKTSSNSERPFPTGAATLLRSSNRGSNAGENSIASERNGSEIGKWRSPQALAL